MFGGRSRASTLAFSAATAAVALPIATGSVASASEQHRRVFAAIHRAREAGRDLQHEQHVAVGQRRVGLVLGLEGANVEIAGVLQAPTVSVRSYCEWSADSSAGRQVVRIGVDREAEQEKLQQRQHDDQPDGHRVAPHLQPFLAQHGHEAGEGEAVHGGGPISPPPRLREGWLGGGVGRCQPPRRAPLPPDPPLPQGEGEQHRGHYLITPSPARSAGG